MMKSSRVALMAVCALFSCAGAVLGCSDDGSGRPECQTSVFCDPAAACGTTVFFKPVSEVQDEIRTYPTDLFTRPDQTTETGIRLNLQQFGYRDEINHLDGFGTFTPMVVAFDLHIDQTALADATGQWNHRGSPVFVMDTTDLDGSDGSDFVGRLIPLYLSYQYDDRVLIMTPEVPMQPATRHALVVTGCQAAADSGRACASPAFESLKTGCPDDFPQDYCDRIHAVLDYLEQPSICLYREDIAVVLAFTTGSTTSFLEATAQWIRQSPPPVPVVTHVMDVSDGQGGFNPDFIALYPGFETLMEDTDLGPYNLDAAGRMIMGTFTAYRFFDPETGLPEQNPETGEPDPQHTEELEFLVVVPPSPPTGGAPTVLFQHAFTVCKESMAALAGTFGKAGLALAGIDLMQHGSRSPDGSGSCEIDPLSFISLSHWNVVTARIAQSIVDLLQFSQMIKNAGLDEAPADGQPDLDTSRLGLTGQSLGAFISGVAGALEPDIHATVINVGGAGLAYFFIAVAFQNYTGRPDYADLPQGFWELFLAFQSVNELSDPANYVPFYLPDGPYGPRNFLIQEAYMDDVVPNYATELLARLVAIPHVAATGTPGEGLQTSPAPLQGNWPDGRTGGFYRFEPAEHDFLLRDHPADAPGATFRGQIQVAVFLLTALQTGSAVIIDPSDPAQIAQYAPFWDLPPP